MCIRFRYLTVGLFLLTISGCTKVYVKEFTLTNTKPNSDAFATECLSIAIVIRDGMTAKLYSEDSFVTYMHIGIDGCSIADTLTALQSLTVADWEVTLIGAKTDHLIWRPVSDSLRISDRDINFGPQVIPEWVDSLKIRINIGSDKALNQFQVDTTVTMTRHQFKRVQLQED